MPSPSTSAARFRPDIAGMFQEYDLGMAMMGFVATQVFPVFEVASATGRFAKIPVEQLLQSPTTLRGPGGPYNRRNWTYTHDDYACQEHGAEEPMDDREMAQLYANRLDAERVAAQRARHAVMEAHERRVAAAVFNATTFSSHTTAVTNEWDDADNATPIDDVEAAVQSVYGASGLWPNALIINRKVARNLRHVAQIVDRLKYNGIQDVRPSAISANALAQVFDIERVIVAGAPKNTADEGQSLSAEPVWSGEYAMVARIASSGDIREPALGRTFHWGADGSAIGGTVEEYRDETVRSDIMRVRMDTDEKLLYTQAGHLLSNITTS